MLTSLWCSSSGGNSQLEPAECIAKETAPSAVVLARTGPAVCTSQAEHLLLTCKCFRPVKLVCDLLLCSVILIVCTLYVHACTNLSFSIFINIILVPNCLQNGSISY